jgi:hypothetical protein
MGRCARLGLGICAVIPWEWLLAFSCPLIVSFPKHARQLQFCLRTRDSCRGVQPHLHGSQ